MSDSFEKLKNALGAHKAGSSWLAKCPAHKDGDPSLSMTEKDGKILFHCQAGCDQAAVIGALRERGLWGSDESPVAEGIPGSWYGAAYVAHWVYFDPSGRELGLAVRYQNGADKVVIPFFNREGSKWKSGAAPEPRPLYGLDRLAKRPDAPVVITEGEKAADAAQGLLSGFVVVTSPGGSKAAGKADWSALKGRSVIVWPDNDNPGAKYAKDVLQEIERVGATVNGVVDVQALGMREKDDAADWPTGKALPDPLPLLNGSDILTPKGTGSCFRVELDSLRAGRFLESRPEHIPCLLSDSLTMGAVGFWGGDGGVGKGIALCQLAVSVASGIPLFDGQFQIETQGKAFLGLGEDCEAILHHRLHGILGSLVDMQSLPVVATRLHENLFIMSVMGEDSRLLAPVDGIPQPSLAYFDLLELLTSIKDLKLVVLDPLSRFYVGNENDTSQATYFVSLLERIAKETGATVIVSQHTNKAAGKGRAALYQAALRGSSGFTNGARWQLNMAGVDEIEAKSIGIDPAEVGRYLWMKVVKKNYGPPEDAFLMRREKHGVLRRVDVPETIEAEQVLDAVRNRIAEEEASGKAYTKRTFARTFARVWHGYGERKLEKLIDEGIETGTISLRPGKNKSNVDTEYLCIQCNSCGDN